jgi:ribosomal protein S18 acetylase RimI-like enzyme
MIHQANRDAEHHPDSIHVSIRLLTPADANTISSLLLGSSAEYVRFFHPFAFDAATIRSQLERAKKDVFFGVDVGSASTRELAGFYMMRGLDEGYPDPMYGVFVSWHYSNKGLARLTLDHAFSFCKLNDYEKILLKVDPRNVRAKKLYESCGFRFLREEPGSHDVVLCKEVNTYAPETK